MTRIRFTVPAAIPGADRSWRKTIRSVNTAMVRGYAVDGDWLHPESVCEASGPGLILGVDIGTPHGNIATVWQIGPGGLDEVLRVARKGPWSGPATIKALAKLAAGRPGCQVTALVVAETIPAAATCNRCRRTVDPGDGTLWRYPSGKTTVRHHRCPPTPNKWAGMCARCGGWLEAGEGEFIGYLRSDVHFDRDRALIVHLDTCPPQYARFNPPDIENRFDGRCQRCGGLVLAGTGLYVRVAVVTIDEHGCHIHLPRGSVRHRSCRRRKRRPVPGPGPLGGRPVTRRGPAGPLSPALTRTRTRQSHRRSTAPRP